MKILTNKDHEIIENIPRLITFNCPFRRFLSGKKEIKSRNGRSFPGSFT